MKRSRIPILVCVLLLFVQLNLFATEKKGKDVIVTRLDGSKATGELIAVRSNSLLLLEKSSQADLLIQVMDINAVKLIKKTKALKSAAVQLPGPELT